MIAMHTAGPTRTSQLREDMVAQHTVHAVVIEVHAEHHWITTCCVRMHLEPVVQVPESPQARESMQEDVP